MHICVEVVMNLWSEGLLLLSSCGSQVGFVNLCSDTSIYISLSEVRGINRSKISLRGDASQYLGLYFGGEMRLLYTN